MTPPLATLICATSPLLSVPDPVTVMGPPAHVAALPALPVLSVTAVAVTVHRPSPEMPPELSPTLDDRLGNVQLLPVESVCAQAWNVVSTEPARAFPSASLASLVYPM